MLSIPPTQDLRGYAAKARLPEMKPIEGSRAPPKMPKPGHKSHRNLLHVRIEPWRLLRESFKISEAHLKRAVLDFYKSFPKRAAQVESADGFSVRATGFDTVDSTPIRPSNISKVADWVENVPLRTAAGILQAAYPETRPWTIRNDEDVRRDVDDSVMRTLRWINQEGPTTGPALSSNPTAMMVFVQPPWILSPADFKNFVNRHKMFTQGRRDKATPLKSSERVWAKIWDCCVSARCRWFVITTYGQWVFGVFSAGWTTGFVSPIMDMDAKQPTVMQCLCYWMMSGLEVSGGFACPEVGDSPIKPWTEPVCTIWDLMRINRRAADAVWRASRS